MSLMGCPPLFLGLPFLGRAIGALSVVARKLLWPVFIMTAAHCELQKDVSAFNVRIGNKDLLGIRNIWVHER